MRQRLIGAAVLVPVVVIVFVAGDPWLTVAVAGLAALAAYETALLLRAAGYELNTWFPVAVAPAAVIAVRVATPTFFGPVEPFPVQYALGFFAIAAIVGATLSLAQRDPRRGLTNAVGNVVAALYPALLAFIPLFLTSGPGVPDESVLGRYLDDGRVWLLVLVLTVWALDTFAYVAGRYHGRGRFMNHISPNKTWSGAIGGTIAAVIACMALFAAAGQNALIGLGLGLLIAVAAQAGDLVESMLKRAAGRKDSGTLIPGHGGILDRLDSFLFAGPVMLVVLVWIRELPS